MLTDFKRENINTYVSAALSKAATQQIQATAQHKDN